MPIATLDSIASGFGDGRSPRAQRGLPFFIAVGALAWLTVVSCASSSRPAASLPVSTTPTVVSQAPSKEYLDCGSAVRVPGGPVEFPFEENEQFRPSIVQVGPFCIDRTEVTIGEYAVCIASEQCSPIVPGGSSVSTPFLYTPFSCDLDMRAARWAHPMVCVNLFDARHYCAVRGGRLPKDTEWLRAAAGIGGYAPEVFRSMRTTGLSFSLPLVDHDTSPVGTHPHDVSRWTVADLVGNVLEWTEPRLGMNRLPHSPPFPSPSATIRGVRVDYDIDITLFRVEYKAPTQRGNLLGFRCAYDGRPSPPLPVNPKPGPTEVRDE